MDGPPGSFRSRPGIQLPGGPSRGPRAAASGSRQPAPARGPVRYRPAYVFAAIGVVVVVILAAAIADPTGKTALYVGVALPILLAFGILVYQWLWAGSQERPRMPQAVGADAASDPGTIADYWAMYRLMAVKPIDPEALAKAQRGVMGVVKANIKLAAVVMVLPIAAGAMVIAGKPPDL